MTEPTRTTYFTPDVQSLIQTMGEAHRAARSRIAKIIDVCGLDWARALLREAHAIEANGGMLILDGSRRRTLGGIWLRLAKERMTDEQHIAVFGRILRPTHDALPTPPPTEPPITWADRGPLINEALSNAGKATNVKIQIIGRPGKIIEKPGFALLLLAHRGPFPSLPKGLPVPETFPATAYAVYIGEKQWRKVKDAIKNPDDMLIVDGIPFYDRDYGAIAVFATSATTKQLARAQREQQQQAQ